VAPQSRFQWVFRFFSPWIFGILAGLFVAKSLYYIDLQQIGSLFGIPILYDSPQWSPADRMTFEKIQDNLPALFAVSKQLSALLGYEKPAEGRREPR
ncbi:MAG: hypothetical protein LBB68_01700, partial [Treponema sp.]|nr:hypothetical protein [Treponema sp.]